MKELIASLEDVGLVRQSINFDGSRDPDEQNVHGSWDNVNQYYRENPGLLSKEIMENKQRYAMLVEAGKKGRAIALANSTKEQRVAQATRASMAALSVRGSYEERRAASVSAKVKGSTWWNDGTKNARSREQPGHEFRKGRMPRGVQGQV